MEPGKEFLTVIMRDTGLRGTRFTAKHGEGGRSDAVMIKHGDTEICIAFDDFEALAKGILELPPGPTRWSNEVYI